MQFRDRTSQFMDNLTHPFKGTSKQITARQAYMKSRYGVDISEKELVKRLYDKIDSAIKYKTENTSDYSLAVTMEPEIRKYHEEVITNYKNRGFNVIIIKDKTNIDGEVITGFIKDTIIINWGEYIPDNKE